MIFSLVSCAVVATPFPFRSRRLPDDRACEHRGRALFAVGHIVSQRRLRQRIDHDHLERIVLGHIGANPDALRAIEAAVNASNVMVIDGEGKATRVGYRRDDESGRNVRVSRRSGKDIS